MTQEDSTNPEHLSMVEMLESAPHFAYLNFEDKKDMAEFMRPAEFLPGDFLICEGELMEAVFFVFEGAVEVVKSNIEGEKIVLATLGRGQILGEAAFNPDKENSTVLIRAKEKTVALTLSKKSYQDMMRRRPKLAFKLLFDVLRFLRIRLNDTSNRLADAIGKLPPEERE